MILKSEIQKLKGEGFLKQKDGDFFSVRILSSAGNFSSKELSQISHISEEYGNSYVGFTTRLSCEIPWIKYEDIDNVKKELDNFNLSYGGTGKKVRPLMACKGTVCTHGIIDTQSLCRDLHEKYFPMDMPSKFKIGVVGCPNNCAKASLNDLGFMGRIVPEFNSDTCVNCGMCMKVCKEGAIKIVDGKINYFKDNCVSCGECTKVCKFNSFTEKTSGVSIFVGGRFGRKYSIGRELPKIYSIDEAKKVCDTIINYYRKNGLPGERIFKLIDRIGFDKFIQDIECN
ncbi:4Fe-4S binding protein [Hathewaya histolytica]|uniref:Sulfite/nitrite reductase family protein n=1 Tax=Hathewaya histolytica TaxID=1498 RepID=A0A4U9R3T8_HATHI|nr:4Fe-4S binding protein [Hathewaya histolytica]VTQ85696.1 sulfite/nitrite reductase family protein [Hathewaya histolytica]